MTPHTPISSQATADGALAPEAGAPDVEVTLEMIEAAVPFAETTLQDYPIADFSIRLLVVGILERAMTYRRFRAKA